MQNIERHERFSGKSARTYLTDSEVNKLIESAKSIGRYGRRDSLMIYLAYRHGLRASELVNLRWNQVIFDKAVIHIERLKHGDPATHPLHGDELRALRQLKRESQNAFVFSTERGGPMEVSGFNKIVKRAGITAGLGDSIHPHMLRHACGHQLAAKGVDTRAIQGYLGHRNIQSTVIYTQLAPERFNGFEKLF